MNEPALRELLRREPDARFQTVRARIREWIDYQAMHRGLPRFAANSEIASWIERVRAEGGPGPAIDQTHELWLEPPDRFRLEWGVSDPDGPRSIDGMLADRAWSHRRGEASVHIRPTSGGLVYLGPTKPSPGMPSADFTMQMEPAIGRLFDPPSFDRLTIVSEGRLGDRDVIHALGSFDGWDRRTPTASEELPPADDYALVVDVRTGVLLREACRFDENEFMVTEIARVSFGDAIDEALFAPPPDLPEASIKLHRVDLPPRGGW